DLIFTVAESPKQKGLIWVGTDDGLIQLTRDDGKTWTNVTPKGFPEWAMISLIEPSWFEAGTAYAAIDAHKIDDFKPYLFKTSDFGKTWSPVATGLPDGSYVHAVREDPKRKGLLYAGTETGAWVSFDDGAHWQALQLNLPTTPVHDLIIHAFTSEETKKDGGPDEWEKDEAEEHIPAKAGLNQFTWDLRYQFPKKIPAAIYDEGEPSGPLVLPGNYQVRLTLGAKIFTAPLEVTMDPRVKTTAEDLRKQFDLLLKMRDRQDEMNKVILAIRDLRGQLEALEKRLGSNEPAKPVVAAAADLRKKISAI